MLARRLVVVGVAAAALALVALVLSKDVAPFADEVTGSIIGYRNFTVFRRWRSQLQPNSVFSSIVRCPAPLGSGAVVDFEDAGGRPMTDRDYAADPLPVQTLWVDPASSGTAARDDFKHLVVCHIKNLCFNMSGFGRYEYPLEQMSLAEQIAKCRDCRCVPGSTGPVPVPVQSTAAYAQVTGHSLIYDAIFNNHQFGHLVQTFGIHTQVLRHAKHYLVPKIDQIVYPKLRPPLPETVTLLHDVMLQQLPQGERATMRPAIWARTEERLRKEPGVCFDSATVFQLSGLIGNTDREAREWRWALYENMGWDMCSCPGPRVVLLKRNANTRPRFILNEDELLQRLRVKHGLVDVVVEEIGEHNSTAEQACLFASSGIVLSSHSSQLMNMIFSNPFACLIEIVPAMMNLDFFNNAHYLALHYDMAIGGHAPDFGPDTAVPERARECHALFRECWGKPVSACLGPKITECVYASEKNDLGPYRQYARAIKHLNFVADLDAVDAAVSAAVEELHRRCNGHWPGVQQPGVQQPGVQQR